MPVRISCPQCDFVLERSQADALPSHCPACGSRITCPRCGKTLDRARSSTSAFRCSYCNLDFSGEETQPMAVQAPEAPEAPAVAIPGIELRGELGRGGMGIVYRAWQTSLRREVAVKVLPPALAASPRMLERFRNEAALAGRLVDAHILPVFEVQEAQGVPIIIMPLVEGKDLGKIVTERNQLKKGRHPRDPHPLATGSDREYVERMLRLLDQVVEAVAVLHREKILHRDIKPSNVLADGHGQCWLTDFGLARLQEQGSVTQTGAALGTPGYASPEQIRGEGEVDARSDVYSLGVTLYQALTLELPYGRGTPTGRSTALLPSRRQRLLGPEIDTVLLKAVEPRREDRYPSGVELREDWLDARAGKIPRHAGRLSRLGRVIRNVRRHPQQVVFAASFVLLFLAGAMLWQRHPATARPKDGPAGKEESVSGPAPRTVHLETEPAGAQVVFVPLHPESGDPLGADAIRPDGVTPLTVAGVPQGEYLVVAEVPGWGFHEVYRIVPPPGPPTGERRHQTGTDLNDGTVSLPKIVIPGQAVTKGMARVEGGDFLMGSKEILGFDPHARHVDSFFMDTTEVTVGAYRHVVRENTFERTPNKAPLPDDYAMTWVSLEDAFLYAERVGKRLPDEAEYEFAATQGGKAKFPWGNDGSRIKDWPLGPVGQCPYDRTPTNPPILGLFSNVMEWTCSRFALYPNFPPDKRPGFYSPKIQAAFRNTFIVRGGFPPMLKSGLAPTGVRPEELNPRWRGSYFPEVAERWLGFRCARSVRPRFLHP